MARRRTLGIMLIATIFLIESIVLLTSVGAAYFWPEHRPRFLQYMLYQLPYFKNLPIAEGGSISTLSSLLALAFAIWAVAKGIGMWFMQRWVRMLILIDLTCRLGDLLLVVGLTGSKEILTATSDPNFVIGSAINIIVMIYLFDSNTAKLFEHEAYTSRQLRSGWTRSE